MNTLKTNAVKRLEKKSTDVLGIFLNALRGLDETNKEVRREKVKRDNQIKVLQEENDVLSRIEAKNEKLYTKINDFLNTD